MILDYAEEIEMVIQSAQAGKTLVVPILSAPAITPSQNPVCAIYIYTSEGVERIIPIRHTEQITGFAEHLNRILQLSNIFVHDKKTWLQIGGNAAVWDVKTLWWYTYSEAYDESHYPTPAHTFYWRRHSTHPYVNSIIPLQQHLAMCQKIRHYAWPMCMNAELTESYQHFDSVYPEVFATIERAGLRVNESFRMPELVTGGFVYSSYNYHTMTGRPSNAARGFNFAAMNKEDGTRDAFCSRFADGALVEMDFDSYHIRLIAKLIGYELPTHSVHDYFGRFYFDTDTITDEQRNESKQISFRLLYGGIDREFLTIPFFAQVNDFIYSLWNQFKKRGYIETPILKRVLSADALNNMTANKLFNYYLQATETEVSVQKLRQLVATLHGAETKIILYTYDSILFDIPITEAKHIIPQLQSVLEAGNFPVKTKVGNIYSKMREL